MKNISTIIGEIHSDINDKLESLIMNNKSFNIVATTKSGSNMLEIVRLHQPELVILSKDLKDKNSDGLELCRQIVGEFPSTIVIITSLFEEPNDLRESMKVGARDFISLPDFEERLVASSIELISSMRKYDFSIGDKKGKVISLISPKGGVGKTTIALNLAVDLASKKNTRNEKNKVLLLDYDLQFGDISYLGSLKPQRTIADLNEQKNIDADLLESHLIEQTEYGFWVLSAPRQPSYADIITDETLQQVINLGKKLFDYIIIDSAQGFHKSTFAAIDGADIIGLVTTAHLVSLKNAKLTIETLEDLMDQDVPKEKVRFIINKYTKTSIPIDEIPKTFGYNLLGYIPKNDNVVEHATNRNQFLVSDHTNSDVAKAIKGISNNVIELFHPLSKKSESKSKNKDSEKSLLGKLFGKN